MRKEWLVVTILTFVTVLAWVTFDLLHTRSEVEIPAAMQQLTEPINPNFDLKGLEPGR